jgi:hypothetical protein
MVDSSNKPMSEQDRDNLINRIDELENLLAQKKAEAQEAQQSEQIEQEELPRLNVGTDGIPVLVEAVTEEDLTHGNTQTQVEANNDADVINDIIDKIDKEITEDLDELILMLKDSIIEEVKTRLLKELKINKDDK